MEDTPSTRPSLLVRLGDPRDERAWAEFLDIYTPLVHRLARQARSRRPTRPTWLRMSSAPWPQRSTGSIRTRAVARSGAGSSASRAT